MLRRALQLGVTFIDTADSYGPEVSERLILTRRSTPTRGRPRDCDQGGLHATRPRPLEAQWKAGSTSRLGPRTAFGCSAWSASSCFNFTASIPLSDQLGALVELQAEGKIGRIGLSEVSVSEIVAARAITSIATVQNRYNLDRSAEPCSPLSARGHRLHPVVPDRHRPPRRTRRAAATDRRRTRCHACAARACLAASPSARSAADPRHFDRRAPRADVGGLHRATPPGPKTRRRRLKEAPHE